MKLNAYVAANKSVPVGSSQCAPHKNLPRLLRRYQQTNYLNTIPNYARDEFGRFRNFVQDKNIGLILDSGCGTGESTYKLARLNPHCIVVGVDKSTNRLARSLTHGSVPDNVIFVRCDLIHFWRLLRQAKWTLAQHYLLYPNPWPKPGQLQRRWHAHPVFPDVIKLGGTLVMRTNWLVYAEEFAMALRDYAYRSAAARQIHITSTMTAFERKYVGSGHPIYEVKLNGSRAETAKLLAE